MEKVVPFRGIRYNQNAITQIGKVLAPPYDVISPAQQKALYDSDEHNVVRLILGYEYGTDTEADNRYTRSSEVLSKWLSGNILSREALPAIYLYAQDYEMEGRMLRRVGFICRRLAEPFGQSVHRHERTLSGPKLDRLKLTRACKTNFSPIFGLYADPEKKLDAIWAQIMNSKKPDINATDDDNVVHQMWVVTDQAVIAQVQSHLRNRDVVIADGHHRYETALNYRSERHEAEKPAGPAEYDYVLMFLSNSLGEGFTVLPTHRLVKGVDEKAVKSLLERLPESFDVKPVKFDPADSAPFMAALRTAGAVAPSFGVIAPGVSSVITLKKEKYLAGDTGGLSDVLRLLDVSVLQELVFERMLGITKEAVADKSVIGYTISPKEAAQSIAKGETKVAFLLNPADVSVVMDVAVKGGVMPQKSTYFYPKLISGLVFNPLT
ncbi:MAG: DUF1015 domain-containing protein [Nitrospinae bacterium]|nr:DUF1015 domain-containing protein [Nitrospinota bacterium]